MNKPVKKMPNAYLRAREDAHSARIRWGATSCAHTRAMLDETQSIIRFVERMR